MDYQPEDEAALRELIERFRAGYGNLYLIEEISARWAEQGRPCDGVHRPQKDIPMPESRKLIMDRLMSELRDD